MKLITSSGEQAIHRAARFGKLDALDRFIHLVDLNATDGKGESALMISAKTGKTNVVERLISAGVDPLVKDLHGCTALEIAMNSSKSNSYCIRALRGLFKGNSK